MNFPEVVTFLGGVGFMADYNFTGVPAGVTFQAFTRAVIVGTRAFQYIRIKYEHWRGFPSIYAWKRAPVLEV